MASQAAPAATPISAAAPAAPAANDGGLPQGIEIFRAGTHRDDQGRTHTFGQEQLAEMAASYNAQLREAPLTVGHPKDNLPAYGWVKRVFINDQGNLAIDAGQVDPAFSRMVQDGRFKKRSASFYPPNAAYNPTPGKWYLRHVAFLGAQPPAVAGLKDISYASADALEALSFSEDAAAAGDALIPPRTQPQEQPMSDAEKAELDKLRADNKALNAAKDKAEANAKASQDAAAKSAAEAKSYAEKAAADRRAGFASFAESEVKAGRLLPKDKNTAIAALEALAGVEQPFSFSEGSNTEQVTALQLCAWLQGQMSSRNPAVSFGEFAGGKAEGFDARGKTDADIDQAAKAYQAKHPEVNYSEAVTAVVTFGG